MTENIQKRGVKATTWDWEELQSVFTADEELYLLRERDIAVLLTAITPAMWSTRWFNQPTLFGDIENFVGELNLRLMTPMDLCQLIADCLLDPDSPAYAALRDTIKDINQGNTDYGGAGSPTDNALDLAFGQNPTCNKSVLWAQCVGLVRFINRTIVDVLEVVETYTNPAEVAAFLGDSVLGKVLSFGGTELADLIGSLADYTIETITDGYAAEYDTALEQEFACLLFCACKSDCQITVDRVYQVFADRASQSVIETSVFDLINAVTGIPIGSATVVPVAFYFWAGLLKTASTFWYEGASTSLEAAIIYSSENPSDDWEVLCTECPEPWTYEWDFTVSNGGWSALGSNQGVWTSGQGWVMQCLNAGGGNFYTLTQISKTVPNPSDILSMEIDVTATLGGDLGGRFVSAYYNPTSPAPTVATSAGSQTYVFDLSGQTQSAGLYALARASHFTSCQGSGVVTKIRVSGEVQPPPAFTGGSFI